MQKDEKKEIKVILDEFKQNHGDLTTLQKVKIKRDKNNLTMQQYMQKVWDHFLRCNQLKIDLLFGIAKYFHIKKKYRLHLLKQKCVVKHVDMSPTKINNELQKEIYNFDDLKGAKMIDLQTYSNMVRSIVENQKLLSVISPWTLKRKVSDPWIHNLSVQCDLEIVNLCKFLIGDLGWEVQELQFHKDNKPLVAMIKFKMKDITNYFQKYKPEIYTKLKTWCDNNPKYKLWDEINDCIQQCQTKCNNPFYSKNECNKYIQEIVKIISKNPSITNMNEMLCECLQIWKNLSMIQHEDWNAFFDWFLRECKSAKLYVLGTPSIFKDIQELQKAIPEKMNQMPNIKTRLVPFMPVMIAEEIYCLFNNHTAVVMENHDFNKAWQICLKYLLQKYEEQDWKDTNRGKYVTNDGCIRTHVSFKTAFQNVISQNLHLFTKIKWIKVKKKNTHTHIHNGENAKIFLRYPRNVCVET